MRWCIYGDQVLAFTDKTFVESISRRRSSHRLLGWYITCRYYTRSDGSSLKQSLITGSRNAWLQSFAL
jgi:hypothetical protein